LAMIREKELVEGSAARAIKMIASTGNVTSTVFILSVCRASQQTCGTPDGHCRVKKNRRPQPHAV
jgi:hypothetical protein